MSGPEPLRSEHDRWWIYSVNIPINDLAPILPFFGVTEWRKTAKPYSLCWSWKICNRVAESLPLSCVLTPFRLVSGRIAEIRHLVYF